MPRLRFDIAIRNAIRDAALRSTPVYSNDRIKILETKKRRIRIRLPRFFRLAFETPFRWCRRALLQDVYRRIDNLQSQFDFLMVNAHLKLDNVTKQADEISSQALAVIERLDTFRAETERRIQYISLKLNDVIDEQLKLGQKLNGVMDEQSKLTPKLDSAIDEQLMVKLRMDGIIDEQSDIKPKLDSVIEGQLRLNQKLDALDFARSTPIEIDAATVAMRTADGFVFVPRSDILLLLALCDAGPNGLEPGTRNIIRRLLRPGMTFVDAGAHIGLLTLAGARAVYPDGKVLAFEPTRQSFEALMRTIEYNNLQSYVIAQCVAVGERRERRTFFTGAVLGHNSFFKSAGHSDKNGGEAEVDVVPLDQIIPKRQSIDVIKIDVEGAELEVLSGMKRLITENPELAVIAEFGPSHLRRVGVSPEKWFESFVTYGFKGYAIDERTAQTSPVKAIDVAGVDSVNIVFVRPGSHSAVCLTP